MSKLVLESNLQQRITELTEYIKRGEVYIGTVIGVNFHDTWYVVGLSKCPKPDTQKEDHATTNSVGKQLATKFSIRDYVDEEWLMDHSRQVSRSLPGGLSVIGVCAFADKQYRQELQPILSKAACMFVKSLQKVPLIFPNVASGQLIMFCDGSVKQPSVSVVNLSTGYPSPLTAPVAFQSLKFARVSCHITFDEPNLIVSHMEGRSSRNFLKVFLAAVAPVISQVSRSIAVFGQELKQGSDLLFGKGDMNPTAGLSAELFLPLTVENETQTLLPDENCSFVNCQGSLHLKGTMECRAFVPLKATVHEAETALKEDILKSLFARTELHYDGMGIIEGEKEDPVALHQLPRRVFAPFIRHQNDGKGCSIDICDYLFEADTKQDSADGLKELFDIPLCADDIEDDLETVLSIEEIEELKVPLPFVSEGDDRLLSSETASMSSSCRSRESSTSRKFNSIGSRNSKVTAASDATKRQKTYIALAIFVVFVAVLLAFLFR